MGGWVWVDIVYRGGVQDTWLLLNFTTIFDMVCIQTVATYDDIDRHMHTHMHACVHARTYSNAMFIFSD